MIISEEFLAAKGMEMESEVIRIDGEIEDDGNVLAGLQRNYSDS